MSENKNDFNEFLAPSEKGSSSHSPRHLIIKVQDKISAELPSLFEVFTLLGLVHLLASVVSLAACPQFGIRLFFDGPALDHFFMPLGHEACFFLCGFFYLGSSFLFAKIVFPTDAWIVLKKSRFISVTALGLLSMGTLSMIGHALSFELSLIWFFGAYLGAWLPFKLQNLRSLRNT